MNKIPPLNRDGEPRAFFGRRAGKTVGLRQRALLQSLLPELAIDLEKTARPDPKSLFPVTFEKILLEIGYGGGEHLLAQSQRAPQDGFIGAEVFSGGIGKMLEKIDATGVKNIRLFTDDALKLLQALPQNSLDGVFVLYPDPWPKPRHHKRRFVSPLTLAALARVLKPGGFFRFASDIEDYANWTLAHMLRTPDFYWPRQNPGAWHEPYAGWVRTRYEQKARREGRDKSFYFTFLRR